MTKIMKADLPKSSPFESWFEMPTHQATRLQRLTSLGTKDQFIMAFGARKPMLSKLLEQILTYVEIAQGSFGFRPLQYPLPFSIYFSSPKSSPDPDLFCFPVNVTPLEPQKFSQSHPGQDCYQEENIVAMEVVSRGKEL